MSEIRETGTHKGSFRFSLIVSFFPPVFYSCKVGERNSLY